MQHSIKLIVIALIIFVSCGAKPYTYSSPAEKIKIGNLQNLYKVSDSVYRSEQPTAQDFRELEKAGFKSVLNLRYSHSDEDAAQGTQLKLYSVPMMALTMEEGKFVQAMKILRDAPKPILVHCQHGSDRTGAVIALYRILFQNWEKADAVLELKYGVFGHHQILFNIPSFIEDLNINKFKKKINE